MAAPSVTYSFTNSTTADATQVNTNFTDLINGASDGTKDYTIGTLVVNGAASFKGAVTLGDGTADDLTFTGSIASTIPYKTNATYNIGAATLAPLSVYLGNGTKSTRLLAGTVGTSWTLTLPNDVPAITGKTMIFNTSGTAEFRYADKFTASKTGAYTATGDETIIPCAPAASFTLDLPAASTATGKKLTIVKTDTDITKVVTIDGSGGETINGATTYALYTQYESVTIVCDGSNWHVTDHYARTPLSSTATITIGAITTPPTKGTIVVDSVRWYRDGQYVYAYYEYEHNGGAPAVGTGNYLFSLPNSISMDTALVTVNTATNTTPWRNATGSFMYNAGAANQSELFAVPYSATQFRLIGLIGGSNNILGSAAGAFNSANASFGGWVKFPAANWLP